MAALQRLRPWQLTSEMITMQIIKRRITGALVIAPIAAMLNACKATAMGTKPVPMSETQQRFNGIGLTLVVDAIEGVEMLGNEFFADDRQFPFYASSTTRKGNRIIMSFPGGSVPEKVRVIWRKSDGNFPPWWSSPNYSDEYGNALKNYIPPDRKPGRETNELYQKEKIEKRKTIAANLGIVHQGPWGGSYFGQVLGDYTLPIASRIPDAVLQEIRKNGGGLRLKFRLKPDGVLFGWDIERFSGGLPRHTMPGGDFLETFY